VVVTTGPGEEALYQAIAASCRASLPHHFAVSFLQLIPLFKRARLVIGGDTGPFHLACALAHRLSEFSALRLRPETAPGEAEMKLLRTRCRAATVTEGHAPRRTNAWTSPWTKCSLPLFGVSQMFKARRMRATKLCVLVFCLLAIVQAGRAPIRKRRPRRSRLRPRTLLPSANASFTP